MSHTTLLLNASFEPVRVVSWQKAFVLAFQGKVEVLEEYLTTVHTVSQSFRVPAVIRLTRWIHFKRPPQRVRFSRTNVYVRDGFQCQYCLKALPERELTLDHIIPVVRGGRKSWENIVAACKKCNQKKGHRTLEESGLRLLRKPQAPTGLPGYVGETRTVQTSELWEPYLALAVSGKQK